MNAFNAVLTASQHAEQAVAAARNEAAKVTQSATQQADRSVEQAQAQASERLAKAQADTSTIINLAKVQQAGNDSGLMLRLYRERMPKILGQAGSVTSVDPNDDSRLIIQGAEQ